MLKIWGRLTSVNVQKVVWCADELAIEYQRVDAGGKFGLVDTPDYLAMNPNGRVPKPPRLTGRQQTLNFRKAMRCASLKRCAGRGMKRRR